MILLWMRLTQQLGYLPVSLTEAVSVVMFTEGVPDLLPDFCGHIAAQLHTGGVQFVCVNGFGLLLQRMVLLHLCIQSVGCLCCNALQTGLAGVQGVKLLFDLLHPVRIALAETGDQHIHLASQFLHVLGNCCQCLFDFSTAHEIQRIQRFQLRCQFLFLSGFFPQQLPYLQIPRIVRLDRLNTLVQLFCRAGMVEP